MKMIKKAVLVSALLAVAGVSQAAVTNFAYLPSKGTLAKKIEVKPKTFISNVGVSSSTRVVSSPAGSAVGTLLLAIPANTVTMKKPATSFGASAFIRR